MPQLVEPKGRAGRQSPGPWGAPVISAGMRRSFAAFAVTAHAAYTYYYALQKNASPGSGFGDNSWFTATSTILLTSTFTIPSNEVDLRSANGNWLSLV